MKQLSLFLTLILTILFLFPPQSEANSVKIHSYLLTEEKEYIGSPHLNTVFFTKLLHMGYRSGKVVISSNPEGTGNIQFPDDLVVNLSTPTSASFRYSADCPALPKPPLDITHLLWKARNTGYANLTINATARECRTFKHINGVQSEYAYIGPLYLVHFDDHIPEFSPFLELPWNYKSKGFSFTDAALSMTSYFDHAYPFLSTTLHEPTEHEDSVIPFNSPQRTAVPYTSHDGYDWARSGGAVLGEPVLAAAAGTATYHNSCKACGNAVHIDHGNGFQTRYYHLLDQGLITHEPSKPIPVVAGQEIGKIGYTGNVLPHGAGGAHIHFMLVQDKNKDGNFNDNIPDGLVDPFGWEEKSDDPWEHHTFSYGGENRTGAVSKYLWKQEIATIKNTVTPDGGSYLIEGAKITIPRGTVGTDAVLTMQKVAPHNNGSLPAFDSLRITLRDALGNVLTSFQKAMDIVITFTASDISRYKPETISIYSSADGLDWAKEHTTINTLTGEAKISVNHLTDFALMGEKLDSTAPVTRVKMAGVALESGIYYSPVQIDLETTDEPTDTTLGIDYTLYKVNDDSWQEYSEPVLVEEQGEHMVSYYSVDLDGNKEEIKHAEFQIDYTPLTPTVTPTPTATPRPTITPTPTIKPTQQPIPTPTIHKKPQKPRIMALCKFVTAKRNQALFKKLAKIKGIQHLIAKCPPQKHTQLY